MDLRIRKDSVKEALRCGSENESWNTECGMSCKAFISLSLTNQ